jgi:hypothetical protein
MIKIHVEDNEAGVNISGEFVSIEEHNKVLKKLESVKGALKKLVGHISENENDE